MKNSRIFEDYINTQYDKEFGGDDAKLNNPPQLTLKNTFVRNGHQRVNTLKLKVDKSGALLIYINTGHSSETDKKNYSLFVCELGNIEKLKDFLKKV